MKKIFPFIITIIFIGNIFSQCPGCVINNTCPASKPNGGICKGVMTGMVAHAYSKDISIYMPKKIICAAIGMGSQCSYVELKKIKVSSITSPIGLSTTSDKTLYNVITGDTIGCIRFCGTPLSAGTYPIVINLLADLKAYGTPGGDVDLFDQPFPYLDTIIILADTTSNAPITSFTYQLNGLTKNLSISKDCDSLVLDSLKALLTGDCNLTKYQWNIKGAGNFLGKIPIVNKIVYKIADTFPTKLTTQFYNYRIKKIEVGSVTGGYSEVACIAAMEECPLFGKPDLYITIDVVAFSNRRNCGNAECDSNINKDANIAFNNLNLTIPSNKCSNTFKLTIYDEDSAPFGTVLTLPASLAATADDKLDEYIVTPALGTITLPNGSNTKTVKITFDTIPAGPPIIETMSIVIHPKPATTSVSSTQDSFCNTQNTDLNIANNGNYVEWYRDTTLLTGLNSNKITATKGGDYKVRLINSFGCQIFSPIKKISMLPFPDALTEYNKDTLKIQGFNLNIFNYEWYIDNILVNGANNKPWILFDKTGFYKAKAFNKYCFDFSEELYYKKNQVGIQELDESKIIVSNNIEMKSIMIDPLPSNNIIYSIINNMGQVLVNGISDHKNSLIIDVSKLPSGIYYIHIKSENSVIKTYKFLN